MLDRRDPEFPRWFSDGELNVCENALDRHVAAGRGEDVALLYESPVTGTRATYTFAEATERVARTAGALRRLGVERGDRVLIYMPMIPDAVFAMLACARLGAIHSVVFGGFASQEVADRIEDSRPKVILTASCGIEPTKVIDYLPLLDGALERSSHQPQSRVVLRREEAPGELGEGDLGWDEFLDGAPAADPVTVSALDPLYVLYTSGTTGKPKGVVRDSGGHAVALHWSMDNIYGTEPGEVFWAASDIGWVVGHSYIVYAPLLAGCATVLFEGKPVGTPDAAAFWRVVAASGVNTLFTAPTALRAIKRADPEGSLIADHDISSLRTLFLAGERTDPDTYNWAADALGVPVVDHWWQTESGWPITAACLGLGSAPGKPGSAGRPVPGFDVRILGDAHEDLPRGTDGLIAIRLPLPPAALLTLWEDDDGYRDAYMTANPGFYTTGDGGRIDEDGDVHVMGRVDDVINVAGHRLSTGAIEGAISEHPSLAECAVIGVPDELKGQVPLAFVVPKDGVVVEPGELRAELQKLVRSEIGAIASIKDAEVVERLPKTRSGKVLRATMRAIAEGRPYTTPATIEDPEALSELENLLQSRT